MRVSYAPAPVLLCYVLVPSVMVVHVGVALCSCRPVMVVLHPFMVMVGHELVSIVLSTLSKVALLSIHC